MIRCFPWLAVGGLTFGLCAIRLMAQNDKPSVAAVRLPVTKILLTNAGIGYYHRQGDVNGSGRVELQVSEDDVNDLILSLLASDLKGAAPSVTYDNRTAAEITLRAFRIDLVENPTVGQLLAQVRGERVEIVHSDTGTAVGSILSVQRPKGEVLTADDGQRAVIPPPAGEVEQINLMTDDGLVSVPLAKVRKVKFLKAELQAEFRAAIEALAAKRGDGRKSVAITFRGEGRRNVSLGYIADAPLWKPTYRLSLDGVAAKMLGYAAVENTTDEDWTAVKVKLVSGRPITFRMDLYDPLYVPRPLVEPELYSSLRPPLYQGVSNLGGQFGIQGAGVLGATGLAQNLGVGGGVVGVGGGNLGQFGNMANRLSFAELQARRDAKKTSAVLDPVAAATANLGEAFEYDIAEPVTLPRFQSALLPVMNDTIQVARLSIYNPAILASYPLLGVNLKNTSKLFLAQGPVTVYDAGVAVGQARLPDVKPGESRLLSYAIDLQVPLRRVVVDDVRTPGAYGIASGDLARTTRVRATSRYELTNRSGEAKTVWVTQPIRRDWKLIAPETPIEQTADLRRFEIKLAANGKGTLDIVEETDEISKLVLGTGTALDTLDRALAEPAMPAAVRGAVTRIRTIIATRADIEKTLAEEAAVLKGIVEEQMRLRANLLAVPKESEAYQRTVKKFDTQETEIETRRSRVKELEASRGKLAAELATLVKDLKAE